MPIHHTKEGRIAKINIDCPPVNAIDSTQWLNLYHIINHANIFGGSYKKQSISMLKAMGNIILS